jgi:hypothetical protein
MAQLKRDTYHRMSHVTGPGCVLVSIRFGTTSESGPLITLRSAIGKNMEPRMNVTEYVEEVLRGVASANEEHQTTLEVEEIEIIPDDFPTKGQVTHCASKLVEFAINEEREQAEAD